MSGCANDGTDTGIDARRILVFLKPWWRAIEVLAISPSLIQPSARPENPENFPVRTAWRAHEDTMENGGAYSSCDIAGARGTINK